MTVCAVALFVLNSFVGFNAPVGEADPLRFQIMGPATIGGNTVHVNVVVTNPSKKTWEGTVSLDLIDGWTVRPPRESSFSVAGGSGETVAFDLRLPDETFNALYPVWACLRAGSEGDTVEGRAVFITSVERPDPPLADRSLPWTPLVLPAEGRLDLWRSPVRRTAVQVYGESKPIVMPVGWAGTEPRTRADVRFDESVKLDSERRAMRMHPPWWRGLAGSTYTDYPLQMPEADVRLRFGYAMTPSFPGEPPSDGVTFRVLVAESPDETPVLLFETNTDAKTWQSAEVDLSAYAGRLIRLRFEVDPGPDRDTTCDRACWAEPTLFMGPGTSPAPPPVDLATGKALGKIRVAEKVYRVLLWPGHPGRPGHRIGFARAGRLLWTGGIEITVDGDRLDAPGSVFPLTDTVKRKTEKGWSFDYTFRHWAGSLRLRVAYVLRKDALQVTCTLPETPPDAPWRAVRIEDVSLGPWNLPVQSVYAGVGNVLVKPRAFSLGFDGHQLATSYVGQAFDADLAVVQAVDVPPTWYEFSPETRRATMHAASEQTMTIIPGPTAWEAARVWRALCGRTASAGVAHLAGRFVFDLWGGRYETNRRNLKRAFQYGLTDSTVVWHVWQRWGYDYRLPDVWPPNPALGSEAELRALSDLCREKGVLFAPHDNYIDLYPDASCFSYDKVAFHGDRTPMRAWLNKGRDAQSYRWRVDALPPRIDENLRLIRDGLKPSAYFIDVWASARPHEYWTRDGRFVNHVQTRDAWGAYFARIREYLDGAPQISESGHDQLVGWLDGAQTNHLRVDPVQKLFTWRVSSEDAERIPWLDFVHHARFALHGAGYPSRYAAGLNPKLHGVYSDDYMATEVLTGHPAMVSRAFGRDVVRKYWLLHGVMRALAGRDMEKVTFIGGDIHRQHVQWSNGGEVHVNRGETDWFVEGHLLPQYGFYARVKTGEDLVEAAIERIDGLVVEWSKAPGVQYVNGRMPSLSGDRVDGDITRVFMEKPDTLALELQWNVRHPIGEDLTIFVHLVDENGDIMMQGDHRPETPTSEWKTSVRSLALIPLPDTARPGQRYNLRLGFFDPVLGRFPYLAGALDDRQRVRFGTLLFTGKENRVTGAEWNPPEAYADPVLDRTNPGARPVDFGGIVTAGGVRIETSDDGTRLTPLPEGYEFPLRLTGVPEQVLLKTAVVTLPR